VNKLIELRYTNVYETILAYNSILFEISVKNARRLNLILFFLGCGVLIAGIIGLIDFMSNPKGMIYVPFLESSVFFVMVISGSRFIRLNSSKTFNIANTIINARLNASKTAEISIYLSETHLGYTSYSIKHEIAWELIKSYRLYKGYFVFNLKYKHTPVFLLNKSHLTEPEQILVENIALEKGVTKLN